MFPCKAVYFMQSVNHSVTELFAELLYNQQQPNLTQTPNQAIPLRFYEDGKRGVHSNI